jgi:hypothetical protein
MRGGVSIANSKLLGDAATSILAVLVDRRRHGDGIIAEVREPSGGRVRPGPGRCTGRSHGAKSPGSLPRLVTRSSKVVGMALRAIAGSSVGAGTCCIGS